MRLTPMHTLSLAETAEYPRPVLVPPGDRHLEPPRGVVRG
jgi:hypothetical protein